MPETTTTTEKKPARETPADKLLAAASKLETVATVLAGLVQEFAERRHMLYDRDEPEPMKLAEQAGTDLRKTLAAEDVEKRLHGILDERERMYADQIWNLGRRVEVLERDRSAIVDAEIERRLRPATDQGKCDTAELRKPRGLAGRGFADVFEPRSRY